MAQSEQALLYVLRSTTTPLGDKVKRAASALDAAPASLTLPALIRDWAFDILLKATRIDSLAAALLDADLWTLTARSTLATQSLNLTTQILPVFVSFVTRYVHEASAAPTMLASVAAVWTRLAPGAMRKATLEAGLEGYEKLAESSLVVFTSDRARSEKEKEDWSQLGSAWLAATRNVVMDAGKGGKRVPTHTLSLLTTLLPLLRALPPASAFRASLLQTIQLALFNLENLRRGLARETYTAGSASTGESSISTVDTEVFAAFRTLGDDFRESALVALPAFTRLYFTSLATHSTVLFPLPARSSFPTPSAQKSALEVLGLTKRRESAGRWVREVIDYLVWSDPATNASQGDNLGDAAVALEGVLAEVENRDLYRPGQADEAWADVLAQITSGCLTRLASAESENLREAVLRVLTLTARLDYAAIQPSLARILHALAHVSADAAGTEASNAFLDYCIEFHSRSLTVPAFLEHLSSAIGAAYDTSRPNNLLTSRPTLERVGSAITSSASSASAMRATWDALIAPIRTSLELEAEGRRDSPDPQNSSAVVEGDGTPKKRKRSTVSESGMKTAAGATRLAAIYLASAPETSLAALTSEIESFAIEVIEDGVKTLCKLASEASSAEGSSPAKKVKKASRRKSETSPHGLASEAPCVVLGVELLELRYIAIERLRRLDLLPPADGDAPKWHLLGGKRRDGLRSVVKRGQGAEVIAAARSLLQYGELVSGTGNAGEDSQETIGTLLDRLAQSNPDSTWTGAVRSLPTGSVGVALYDTILRRWLRLVSRSASSLQLAEFSRLVAANIARTPDLPPSLLSIPSITHVILRRSDFWEETALREQLLEAIRGAAILPGLSTPQGVLAKPDADSKAADARKSLQLDTLIATARFFRSLASSVPAEYLGSAAKTTLVEAALALDLWLSGRMVGSALEAELGDAQCALRGFVLLSGAQSVFTAELASELLETTSATARAVTVSLYDGLLINPAVIAAKSEPAASALLAILEQLQERPLGIKVVRERADGPSSVIAAPSDLVTLRLYDALSEAFAGLVNLPMSIRSMVQDSVRRSVTSIARIMPLIAETIGSSDLFNVHQALDAVRIVWTAERRFGLQENQIDYSSFATAALQSGLAQLASFRTDPTGPEVAQTLLGLIVLQAQNNPAELSAKSALEPALAGYLAFQAALPREAWMQLDAGLISVATASNEVDYEASLSTLIRHLSTCSDGVLSPEETTALLEQMLSTTLLLLLSGPEGSGRIATAALAEILRDVAVIAANISETAAAPACYLAISRFLDSLCAERPLLLSRLNTSAVLSLVAVCLRPVVAESALTSSLAGDILRHFVAATGHLVRHRKDHLVSLFPALVAVMSGFLAVLRIGGLGSLGTSASLDDTSDTSMILGQRAEREAKETFPAWVWAGGRRAIGRTEAKAVSRLLGSLGAKTTTTTGSGKRRSAAADPSASTTSLTAPLSKHAPFLLLNYLRACVHPTCPIPSALRSDLQGGWFEVMDAMGKWEREALMKGLLGDEEEAERGVLRSMWAAWEKERYRG